MTTGNMDVESMITLDLQKQVIKKMKLSHTDCHNKMVGLLQYQDLGKLLLSVIKLGFM